MRFEPPSAFARHMAEEELHLEPNNDTDEFIKGVVSGFHRHGKDVFRSPEFPPVTSWGLCYSAIAEIQRDWGWNDAQCLDYVRGFLAGYRVRQEQRRSTTN